MSKPRYGWWPYAKWMIRNYKGGGLSAAYKDDIDKLYAYAKDLNEDWVWTGPGPDPRGEEGDLGPGVTKEANQCEDASGRGND